MGVIISKLPQRPIYQSKNSTILHLRKENHGAPLISAGGGMIWLDKLCTMGNSEILRVIVK